ncbi:MAG: hypothetical protein ABR501_09290 [Pyrinomonadaceae bacterium]
MFDNETWEEFVFKRWSPVALRASAVRALEESTKIFEKAFILLKEGRRTEADKLRSEARAKRNHSVWLMAKANELERKWGDNPLPHYQKTNNSTFIYR